MIRFGAALIALGAAVSLLFDQPAVSAVSGASMLVGVVVLVRTSIRT